MTPAEHYAKAEEWLALAMGAHETGVRFDDARYYVQLAQVHATLASSNIKMPTNWGTVIIEPTA